MARQIIVLALVFVAIVGAVSATKQEQQAAQAPVTETATAPVAEAVDGEAPAVVGEGGETIGATDAAAPSGELGPAAAEARGPTADKKNGASALRVPAAVAGVVAVAGFLSF